MEIKLCECGCGYPAPLAKYSSIRDQCVKGHPRRFISGHNAKKLSNIQYTVDKKTGCWNWQRMKRNGYGLIKINRKTVSAHRYIYEQHNGEIPNGLFLDHLCKNPSCVNPHHLEPVNHAENCRRGLSTILTAQDVKLIKSMHANNKTQRFIAKKFNVHFSTINAIIKGRLWKNIK